jgi:hypothetical protein
MLSRVAARRVGLLFAIASLVSGLVAQPAAAASPSLPTSRRRMPARSPPTLTTTASALTRPA